MTRRYVSEILPIIGPEKDIPAPDVGTDEQTMAWMMDTYSIHSGYTVTGVVTGKPVSVGGSRGPRRRDQPRRHVRGLQRAAGGRRRPARRHRRGAGLRQGRRAGRAVPARRRLHGGRRLRRRAAACTTATGSTPPACCGTCEPARRPWSATRAPTRSPTRSCSSSTWTSWCRPRWRACIHEDNATRVRARFVVEGANGPTTPDADAVLDDNGVSWSSRTCWPTPAASRCRTSSGCRTCRRTSGPRTRSTTGSRR